MEENIFFLTMLPIVKTLRKFQQKLFKKYNFQYGKMGFNPLNVIKLLQDEFNSFKMEESPVTTEEVNMKNRIREILLDAMTGSFDCDQIESLCFDDCSNGGFEKDNDENGTVLSDESTSPDKNLDYPPDYKAKAVQYWLSGKKRKLSLKSVQQKFKLVKSLKQLYRWKNT